MFERRLKIILAILGLVIFVLMGRAAQVQIVNREYWRKEAAVAMGRTQLIRTSRGAIRDRNGRVLAVDYPCVDACVDYPALTHPPDPEWLRQKAAERLRGRLGDAYDALPRKRRLAMRNAEVAAVQADVDAMWAKLAEVSHQSHDEVEAIRESVIRRVQMRQRYVWHKRLEEALRKQGKHVEEGTGTLKRLLTTDDGEAEANVQVVVAEQKEAHVILRALDPTMQNELGKNIERYPGLVLQPGTHRYYPYVEVAAHLLGNLARVDLEDMKANTKDELRDYLPNELIGRSGIESLCEPALRGVRGRVERTVGEESVLARREPVPGRDVKLTIDVELQQQMQTAFTEAILRDPNGQVVETNPLLHGAAVVIDVNTNDVLALVSYPTFDANRLEELYSRLHDDDFNEPLRNRATMSQFEPGSTVKPLCGMAGIAQGVVGVNEGIECTGYMKIDGKPISNGRCWIASTYATLLNGQVAHHPVPYPHQGHDGNLDGFLTYSDGLERSCNVYFETVADRLGVERLSEWYERFGLGRPTGIGIPEARGRLPRSFPVSVTAMRRSTGFFAGIGQGWIAATPIQMANAVAMLARGGIWMRPRLLLADETGQLPPVKADAWHGTPERVDLHLPPEAIAAARDGMWRVVNGRAGTGKALAAGDPLLQSAMICGKTGTAQATPFSVPVRDEAGRIVRNEKGAIKRVPVEPSTPEEVNPQAPWYRKDKSGKIDHSWYVGFAPAEKPQIAFAVLVEYGGSGGVAAAAVARQALEACISHHHLVIPAPAPRPTTQTASGPATQLQDLKL